MKQLKDTVERIVHPILAGEQRKNKMREELLVHLTEIYNEELAKGVTENTALEQTLQRFGNTSDIQRDLQSSVPFYERIPQIIRSLFFATSIFLIFALFWHQMMTPLAFHIRIWMNSTILISLIALVLSYISRILPSRPLFNMTYQFLGLYLFDLFISGMIWPRYKAILYEMERDMGFSHSLMVYRIWNYGFLLVNIFFLLWIWKTYKRKENHLPISPKAQHYRNISILSGVLSILTLAGDFRNDAILQLLSFPLILNSIIFCVRSYGEEKRV